MKNDTPLKNFSFVAIARISSAGLQGIFYLLLAKMLEPSIYGEVGYFISIAATTALIGRLGLSHSVIVYHGKKDLEFVKQANFLVIITSCVGFFILLFVDVIVAILSLGMIFFVMSQFNLLGSKEYKKHMLLAILRGVVTLILPITLYFIFDISGILIGLAIGNLLSSFDFIKYVKNQNFHFDRIKTNYKIIIHNFGVDTSSNLPRVIDRLVIGPLFGFAILGIYQLNLQILFALEMLPIALHGFLLSEESSGKSNKRISILIIATSCIIAITIIVISPVVIQNLFPNYEQGVEGLQVVIISLIPISILAVLNAKLQSIGSTKIGFSAIIRIGSLLILLAILGDMYGIVGLSYAVLISVILQTIFVLILFKKSKFETS